MRFFERYVVFSCDAFNKLSASVAEAGNLYEVGGVLLGHSCFHIYFIVDATVPKELKNKSNISFVLDGEKEIGVIEKIRAHYLHPPRPLGIWHSHANGTEIFSTQDKLSNQKISKSFGGSLSIIAIQSDIEIARLFAYYISPNGSEQSCKITVDNHNRIPKRYFKIL